MTGPLSYQLGRTAVSYQLVGGRTGELVSMDTGGIGIHSEGKQPDTGIPDRRNGNVQSSQLEYGHTLLSCPPGFPSTQWCSTVVHSTTLQCSTVYLLMSRLVNCGRM